jgi:hypothetical protein
MTTYTRSLRAPPISSMDPTVALCGPLARRRARVAGAPRGFATAAHRIAFGTPEEI